MVQNPITKSWNDLGIITKGRPLGRAYEVLMDSGKTILRNRTLLRPSVNHRSAVEDSTPRSTATTSQRQPSTLRRSERLSKKNWSRCQAIRSPRGGIVGRCASAMFRFLSFNYCSHCMHLSAGVIHLLSSAFSKDLCYRWLCSSLALSYLSRKQEGPLLTQDRWLCSSLAFPYLNRKQEGPLLTQR